MEGTVFNTSGFFQPGKLSVVMDGQAGSSGKGKVSAFISKHADNWTFACNAFSAQAGHWVRDEDDRGQGWERFYQTLPSCAKDHERYEALYVGPGAVIEERAFWRELEENRCAHKVMISPMAIIIQQKDVDFERGLASFEGVEAGTSNALDRHDGTMLSGSTCHGVGAAIARRVLRRALLASEIPSLRPFLGDVPASVMARLDSGQAGMLELAQGFQLSNMHPRFYPHVTSRNVTVAQGFADMMLPPRYLGKVLLNFRTFPIRINSRKFIGQGGKHLTWQEVQDDPGSVVSTVNGDSGGWYPDQTETHWDHVTKQSGSPSPIMELTSVTKLPRRVATFSAMNLQEAIKHNGTGLREDTLVSINFLNYVDYGFSGRRNPDNGDPVVDSFKVNMWLDSYVKPVLEKVQARLWLLGTGAQTDDFIQIGD